MKKQINWFKFVIAISALFFVLSYAFGQYINLKAHNSSVLNTAMIRCSEMGIQDSMNKCVNAFYQYLIPKKTFGHLMGTVLMK